MFAAFAKSGPSEDAFAVAGRKKKTATVNMANVLYAEQEAEAAKKGKKKPQQQQGGGGGGGGGGKFHEVKGKQAPTKSAKQRKAEQRKREEEEELEQLEAFGVDVKALEAQRKAEKSAKKKWGAGPPGSRVVDPEEEKARRKAIEAQKKHVSKQVVRAKAGDVITKQDADLAFAMAAQRSSAEAAQEALHSAEALPMSKKKHVDPTVKFVSNSQKLDARAADTMKAIKQQKGQQQKGKKQQGQQHAPAGQGKKVELRHATAAATQDLAKMDKASLRTHERAADGSSFAVTRLVFVLSGKNLLQVPDEDGPEQVAAVTLLDKDLVKQKGSVKGGFFMTVEGKHFSDMKTVDEPWMAETWLKAVAAALTTPSKPATATPFYTTNKGDTVEAAVEVKVCSAHSTSLEITHKSGTHSQLATARVSLEPFVRDLVRQAKKFVNVLAALEALRAKDGREGALQCMPQHLEANIEKAEEALAAYLAAEAATAAANDDDDE